MPAFVATLRKRGRATARILRRELQNLGYRIQRAAFGKFPWIVPDPDYARLVAEATERDEEDNAKSHPSTDERIDLRCIWVVELYTPSHIDGLLRGFATLGWDIEDALLTSRNPVPWVRSLRAIPHGSGSFNLGIIQQLGRRNQFMVQRTAPLPTTVEYALGEVYALSSSITCVVMAFIFTEEYASRLDRALRQNHATKVLRQKRSYRFYNPISQKREAIARIRSEAYCLGADWFRTHLPGLFASQSSDGSFPTCELLSLSVAEPFPKFDAPTSRPEYVRLLGIGYDFDAWRYEKGGFIFAWPLRQDDDRFHAIVAFRESDLDAQDYRHHGSDRWAPVHYISERVDGLLSRWALLSLLSGYERKLNSIRDSTLFHPRSRRTMQLLRSMRRLVAETVDVAAVTAELVRYSQRKWTFELDVSTFRPCDPNQYRDEKITIGGAFAKQVEERGIWLTNMDRSIRDLLLQHSTVIGTHENIKLQRYVIALSVLALILSIIAIWVSGETTKFQAIVEWFGRLLPQPK